MTEIEKINFLKKINFGDIDANADPNLSKYFVDSNYWDKIIKSPIYYVVGKKGTGKSALYQILKQKAIDYGAIISNKDFGDFPFKKLALLCDDDFSKPNQYQSIWQHVIMNLLVEEIIKNQEADVQNEYYKEIKKYYDICIGNTIDLHKTTLTHVKKNGFSLVLSKLGITPSLSQESSNEIVIGDGNENIAMINSKLLSLINDYLMTRNEDTTYLLQFDRLDDTYNQFEDIETYYHVIISLMKIVYSINNTFRRNNIDNAKIIVYLRTDIINELPKRDSESARWEDYMYKINWAIINQNDWANSMLLHMVNKRICVSLNDVNIKFNDIFDNSSIDLRNHDSINDRIGNNQQDIFKYIVDKTFHRPRDVIQFCKYIQREINETTNCTKINYRNIKNAEKQYSYWLVNSELSNEINPVLKNVDVVYEFLKSLGRKAFSFSDFYTRYNRYSELINLDKDKLIEYLYNTGILLNTQRSLNGVVTFRSIIRNQGKVDRSMKLMIHPGVWSGLNA